jgi:hypothetical protein
VWSASRHGRFTPEKFCQVPIVNGALWDPGPVGTFLRREKSLTSIRNRSTVPQLPVSFVIHQISNKLHSQKTVNFLREILGSNFYWVTECTYMFFVVFISHCRNVKVLHLKRGHDLSFRHPFRFFIHKSFYHSTLHPEQLIASLNQP